MGDDENKVGGRSTFIRIRLAGEWKSELNQCTFLKRSSEGQCHRRQGLGGFGGETLVLSGEKFQL